VARNLLHLSIRMSGHITLLQAILVHGTLAQNQRTALRAASKTNFTITTRSGTVQNQSEGARNMTQHTQTGLKLAPMGSASRVTPRSARDAPPYPVQHCHLFAGALLLAGPVYSRTGTKFHRLTLINRTNDGQFDVRCLNATHWS
jgi:hypothetical protein